MKNHDKIIKKIMSVFMVIMILLLSIFSNTKISYSANGTFRLVLREQGTRNTIEGATFKIYKKSDRSKYWTRTTGRDGSFEILLPEDIYVIKQESAPSGYVKEDGELSRTVNADVRTMFVMENNRVGSNGITSHGVTTLRLKAVNSKNSSQVIAGAKFVVKGRFFNKNITTGSDGYAYLNGLEEGETYIITQIGEVDGYMPKPDDTTVYIPNPAGAKYSEFADVTIGNMPYDKSLFGVLTINVEEDYNHGGTRGRRIPNVKVKVTDDLGNTQVGITDSNGTLKIKNVSFLRTYKAEIIDLPYEYDRKYTFADNIRINEVGNTQTQTMYLPRAQLGLLTINNYETGDFNVKISGSKFKLIHPDGTSRIITVNNGVYNVNLPNTSDDGIYRLIQLSTDESHVVNSTPFEFTISRPVEININNNLIDPTVPRVSFRFEKVWGDTPDNNITSKVKLLANGNEVAGQVININSNSGTSTHTFTNLPKYDSNNLAINYTIKEDPINDWYAEYEEIGLNNWRITNYKGSLTGTCYINPTKSLAFYSTDNTAYMTENGDTLKKTITFQGTENFVRLPSPGRGERDKSGYGHGIAYDKINNNLYGVNGWGYLAVNDVGKGRNGQVINVVYLEEVAREAAATSFNGKIIPPDFKKVNSLETTVDGKYLLVRALAGHNIYMYKISDILSAGRGATVRAKKVLPSVHRAQGIPVSDGDIIQYPNGDILYTGHELRREADWSRYNFEFYMLKYNGPLDSNGRVIDASQGSYSAPVSVGGLLGEGRGANSWQDGLTAYDHSIEGMTLVNGKIYFTSNYKYKNEIIEWNMGIIDNPPTRNNSESTIINYRLHSLKNIGKSNLPRTDSQIKSLFGGNKNAGNLETRISAFNSQFSDMTGAEREHCNPEITIRGKKTWVGDEGYNTRPRNLEVQLYADGNPFNYSNGSPSNRVLNEEGGWAYTFTNLPKLNSQGKKIVYTVKETNPPSAYLVTKQDYSIINTLLKGSLSIKKTNSDKRQTLSGAGFSLWNEDKSKQIVGTQMTAADGIVTFNNLPAGTYYLKEDVVPNGYIAKHREYKVVGTVNQTTKKVDFVVSINNSPVEIEGDKFVIKNDVPNFKIKLLKVDETSNEKINLTSRFEVLDSTKRKLKDAVLNNGELLLDRTFTPGKYYLREIDAPQGYIQIREDIEINIDSEGRVVLGDNQTNYVAAFGTDLTRTDTIELRVRNRREDRQGRFVINKTDDTPQHNSLRGAVFRLIPTNQNGTPKPGGQAVEKTSEENGRVIYDNLNPGFYKLEEIQAPQNYIRTTRTWKIEVQSNGTTIIRENPQSNGRFRSVSSSSSPLRDSLNEFMPPFRRAIDTNFNLNSSINGLMPIFRNARSASVPIIENLSSVDINNFRLKQTISTTGTQGKYKVDVEIVDQRDDAEIVIIVEDTNSTDRNAINRYKHRDDNTSIGYIKENLLRNINIPNAKTKVTIIGANDVATTYVDRQTKDQAISRFTHMNGGNESNRNGLKDAFERALNIMQNSNAKNKTVIALTGRTVYKNETVDFRRIESIINELQGNLKTMVMATSEVSYRTPRSRHNDQKNFSDLPSKLGIDDERTFDDGRDKGAGVSLKTVETSSRDVNDARAAIFASDEEIHRAYQNSYNRAAIRINENYAKARKVSPTIRLSNNVVFDRFENATGINHNSGTISGTLNIPENNTVRFSYYVKSNLSNRNIRYNVLENINTSATMTENVYGHSGNLPIPKVNIPGVTINVNKSWDSNVLPEDKVEVTAVLKNGNNIIERLILNTRTPRKSFRTLPKFDSNGRDIIYRVEEIQNNDILTSGGVPLNLLNNSELIRNINITTSYTTTSMRVRKNWISTEERDKLPVTVRLIARTGDTNINVANLGNQVQQNIVLNTRNNWTAVFNNLPRVYNGRKIEYSVEEIKVGNDQNKLDYYEVSYINGEESVVITNKKSPEITVVNEAVKYKFKIVKVDQHGTKITSNSRFSIDSSATEDNIYNNQIANLSNGEFEFNNGNNGFLPGTYYLREVTSPDNYLGISEKIKIEITSTGELRIKDTLITGNRTINPVIIEKGNNNLITIKVKNEPVNAKFAISKRIKGIETTERYITSPVTFQLTKDGDNSFNAINLTKPANENFVFENLPVGTYTLKETQVPSGYVKAKEYYKVVVENNGDLVFKTYTDPQNGQSTERVNYDGSNLTLHKQSEKRITKSEQSNIDNNLRDDNKLILIGNIQNPKLKLRKVNTNNALIQNSNAVFKLYKIDNNSNNSIERNSISGNPVLTLSVGNNGESNEINPLTLTELGKYALVEETAPNGYERIEKPVVLEFYEKDQVHSPGVNKKVTDFRVLSDEFRNTVNISRADNDPNLLILSVKNTKIVDFSIRKLNDNTNNLLNGVRFKLAPKDRNTPDPGFDNLTWHQNNMSASESNEQIDGQSRKVIKWTYQNGKVPGIRVKEGIYVLTEESTPDTHEPIPPLEILVDSTGVKANPNSTLEIRPNTVVWPAPNVSGRPDILIRNFKRPQITIEKVGENGITKLPGVRLKIKSKDANTPKPLFDNLSWHERNMSARVSNLIDEKWISWQTHATEKPGIVLREGTYIIEEESVPTGYTKFQPFEIRVDQAGNMTIQNNHNKQGIVSEITNDTSGQRLRLVLKNERDSISIKLKKVLENNENNTIDGVKFKFFRKHATENKPDAEVGEFTTSNGGIITIPNITPGEYFIKETEVPQSVNNNSRALYKLNDKYYKLNVDQNGRVTFADKALIRKGNNYSEVDKDNDIVLGDFEDNVQNITFKNKIQYKVLLQKNFYIVNREPTRLFGINFYIRPKNSNAPKIKIHNYSQNNEGFSIINRKFINGVKIAKNGIAWSYNKTNINPVFLLSPGDYIVEELNTPGGYEKIIFEFNVNTVGEISVANFEKQKSDPQKPTYGFADGNILSIEKSSTNNIIHMFNKKPMEIYLNKVDQNNERISKGNLKLKLAGAKVFDKAGQDEKVDEFTLDLSRNFVKGKGLKIPIPKEIKSGTYILSELEAPLGYAKTNVRYHIQIDQFLRRVKLIKTDTGEDTQETVITPEKVLYSETYNAGQAVPNTNSFEIVNKKAEYPATGGFGTIITTILGLLITSVSSIMIYNRRKSQN